MKNILILLLSVLFSFHCAYARDYIVDTDIGGDVDDVLALLVALDDQVKPLAVTTVHIEPVEKARIAKLIMSLRGYPDIPVYAGIGTKRSDSRELFMQQNPLWAPAFGYPASTSGEKIWFPAQAAPYQEAFAAVFAKMHVEEKPAAEFIADLAKQYSPENKLVIVALGPLHNVDAALMIDPSIKKNILLYSMGGVYPKGYNWLVSPAVTARVLAQVETIAIIGPLIDANDLYIPISTFEQMEKNAGDPLAKAIIIDWKNWYKMDVEKKKTHLSDPVTLYLALHPEDITLLEGKEISFPCLANGELKPEFAGLWYNMPGMEDKIMKVNDDQDALVKFVTGVNRDAVLSQIILRLEHQLQ